VCHCLVYEMQLSCHWSHRLVGRWGLRKVANSWGRLARLGLDSSPLTYVDLFEAEAVEEGGDGGAGVFAGGVEDAVGEGGGLELLLGLGASVGFEVGVGGDEEAGGADVDAGVLIVDRGEKDLGGGQGNVDGLAAVGDADVFRFEPGEVDAGDGLAVDDEEEAIAGEQVGEDGGGFGAFDDGVDGVDDGFEAVEALDLLDDGRDGGVKRSGAAGDEAGEAGGDADGGLADEDDDSGSSEKEGEEEGEKGSGGAAAGAVLGRHGWLDAPGVRQRGFASHLCFSS
jgi:hypothetical protein